jgi:hypothetical protein
MHAKGYRKESSVMDFHQSELGGSLVKKLSQNPAVVNSCFHGM